MRIYGLIVLLRAANRIVCAAENKADGLNGMELLF